MTDHDFNDEDSDDFSFGHCPECEESAGCRNSIAEKHGTYRDWCVNEVYYLLEQLRDGHFEDCGDGVKGFMLATGLLQVIIGINRYGFEGKGAEVALNGIWMVADYLSMSSDNERVEKAAGAIAELSAWTCELDLPMQMQPCHPVFSSEGDISLTEH